MVNSGSEQGSYIIFTVGSGKSPQAAMAQLSLSSPVVDPSSLSESGRRAADQEK